MEGLKFGWKKSVKQWHFFEKDATYSICCHAKTTTTEFKKAEFLSEIEFTPAMEFCLICPNLVKNYFKNKIKRIYREETGIWDDTHICPKCKSKVIFFNSNKVEEHMCTICNKMVTFA